jgi:tRNA-specific 2-thiouridylase
MLATVDPGTLAHVEFPLGDATKAEVRAEATVAGLAVARRPESQEACFLAGGDYRSFLGRHGVPRRAGAIVDESGTVVGRHDGIWQFTPGQRRGIGVAAAEPLYALRADPVTNTLVVGRREALGTDRVRAQGSLYVPVTRAQAKLRYRSAPVEARVEEVDGGFTLALDEAVEAVAPGQVAVLYDDDAVVGAGVIRRTGPD